LDDYQREELLAGPGACLLAGVGYFGIWGPNLIEEAPAEIRANAREAMARDWARHGEELLAWWVGETGERFSARPWIFPTRGGPGTRPWGWWTFDSPEPREEGEAQPNYLDRLKLWRPGERQRYTEAAHAD
jgi:hypothetical protein